MLFASLTPFENDVYSQNPDKMDFWIIANDISDSVLSVKEIQSIFLGENETWENGNRIRVVFHKSQSNEFELTSKLLINSSTTDLKKYWLSLVFQGRANSPIFKDNCEDIVEYVRNNEGAIAIIYSITPPRDLHIKIDE